MELVVAQVLGLKGFLDNWLKGLSPLTLPDSTNARHIIKSFLELLLEAPIRPPLARRYSRLRPYGRLLDILGDVTCGGGGARKRKRNLREVPYDPGISRSFEFINI